MVDYNARKASTLPVVATADPDDLIMVIHDGAPPDVVLTPMDALASLAGSYAPQGEQGIQGPQGEEGPPGRDLAVKGSVPTEADLAALTGLVDGDTYVTADSGQLWVYDAGPPASWTVIATAVGPKGDTGAVGPVGPAGPQGAQGVQGPQGVGIAGANVPVGTVLDFVGVVAPPGFLLCDGTDYEQTAYPQLAALLVGSGWAQSLVVGRFKVPNLNGRVTAGLDPFDPTFGSVGKTAGTKDSVNIDHSHPAGGLNMASHTHPVKIWTGYFDSNHLHGMQHTHPGVNFNSQQGVFFRGPQWNAGGYGGGVDGAAQGGAYFNPPTGNADRTHTDAMDRDSFHRHYIDGNTDGGGGAVTGSTAPAGVAGTNRNLPPYAVLLKIIRATV